MRLTLVLTLAGLASAYPNAVVSKSCNILCSTSCISCKVTSTVPPASTVCSSKHSCSGTTTITKPTSSSKSVPPTTSSVCHHSKSSSCVPKPSTSSVPPPPLPPSTTTWVPPPPPPKTSSSCVTTKSSSSSAPPKPNSSSAPPKPSTTSVPPKPSTTSSPPKPSTTVVPPKPSSTYVAPPKPSAPVACVLPSAPVVPSDIASHWSSHNPFKDNCITPLPSSISDKAASAYAEHAAWYNSLLASVKDCPDSVTKHSTLSKELDGYRKAGFKDGLPGEWEEFAAKWKICGKGNKTQPWNPSKTPEQYQGAASKSDAVGAAMAAVVGVVAFALGL